MARSGWCSSRTTTRCGPASGARSTTSWSTSGELVRCSLIVQREKGTIKLINLTSKITDLLAITKLLTIFDTFDSEEACIKAMRIGM